MKLLTIACLVLLLGGMTGCADQATQLPGPRYTLDMSTNNTAVKLKVGDYVKIVLKENPSTGYQWFFTTSDNPTNAQGVKSAIEFAGQRVIQPDRSLTGAPNTLEVMVRAIRPGKIELNGYYTRAWEKNKNTDVSVKYYLDIE